MTAEEFRATYDEWADRHGVRRILGGLDGACFLYFATCRERPIKIGYSKDPTRRILDVDRDYRLQVVVDGFDQLSELFLHERLARFLAGDRREFYRFRSPIAELMERLCAASGASFVRRVAYKPRKRRRALPKRAA